jgi:hypothetical protein
LKHLLPSIVLRRRKNSTEIGFKKGLNKQKHVLKAEKQFDSFNDSPNNINNMNMINKSLNDNSDACQKDSKAYISRNSSNLQNDKSFKEFQSFISSRKNSDSVNLNRANNRTSINSLNNSMIFNEGCKLKISFRKCNLQQQQEHQKQQQQLSESLEPCLKRKKEKCIGFEEVFCHSCNFCDEFKKVEEDDSDHKFKYAASLSDMLLSRLSSLVFSSSKAISKSAELNSVNKPSLKSNSFATSCTSNPMNKNNLHYV